MAGIRFLLKCLSFIPLELLYPICFLLAKPVFYIFKSRRKIIETNINKCFPGYSKNLRKRLVFKNSVNVLMGIFEACVAVWRSDKYIRSRVHMSGIERVVESYKSGKSIILVMPHTTTMTLSLRACSIYLPLSLVMRRQSEGFVSQVVNTAVKKFMYNSIDNRDARTLVKTIKLGNPVIILPDHDLGRVGCSFVKFFGVEAATTNSIPRLTRIADSEVIIVTANREKYFRYKVKFSRKLDNYPSSNFDQDTLRINAELTSSLMPIIDQYYWIHRRFKTRKNNTEKFY